jgi:hypothetical protein
MADDRRRFHCPSCGAETTGFVVSYRPPGIAVTMKMNPVDHNPGCTEPEHIPAFEVDTEQGVVTITEAGNERWVNNRFARRKRAAEERRA